ADLLQFQLQLEQRYGLRLPGAFFFQYNTLAKVIDYLGQRSAPAARPAAPAAATPAGAGDIAIVGMSCRLPGGIETPEGLWQLLMEGGSA
ncbi:phosphopantetheine-binding protein, partial [Escherichia coli]|nr:phosphopantetheine-binding protein [Escherichia coli]